MSNEFITITPAEVILSFGRIDATPLIDTYEEFADSNQLAYKSKVSEEDTRRLLISSVKPIHFSRASILLQASLGIVDLAVFDIPPFQLISLLKEEGDIGQQCYLFWVTHGRYDLIKESEKYFFKEDHLKLPGDTLITFLGKKGMLIQLTRRRFYAMK